MTEPFRDIFAKLSAPFPAESISWRPGAMSKDQTSGIALAYIDARDVMDRLDAVAGPENWQCRYTSSSPTVCEIGLRDHTGQWVWKADGSGETDVEAEKGALSGAFKRAAVRWGIGRYLYALKSPWVDLVNKRITQEGHVKLNKIHDDFVKQLEWGGEVEGPIVATIVRALRTTIQEMCKTKSEAIEFASKNDAVLKSLPMAAQKTIHDAISQIINSPT